MAAETVESYTMQEPVRSAFSPENMSTKPKDLIAEALKSTAKPMKLEAVEVE